MYLGTLLEYQGQTESRNLRAGVSQRTYKGITTEIKAILSLSTAGGRRQCDDVFKGLRITNGLLKKRCTCQLALKARAP